MYWSGKEGNPWHRQDTEDIHYQPIPDISVVSEQAKQCIAQYQQWYEASETKNPGEPACLEIIERCVACGIEPAGRDGQHWKWRLSAAYRDCRPNEIKSP